MEDTFVLPDGTTIVERLPANGFLTDAVRYRFPNGYTASVIRGTFTYGGRDGLWEVGVMYDGSLVYDTPVTSDVLGHLDKAQVSEALAAIAELPPR